MTVVTHFIYWFTRISRDSHTNRKFRRFILKLGVMELIKAALDALNNGVSEHKEFESGLRVGADGAFSLSSEVGSESLRLTSGHPQYHRTLLSWSLTIFSIAAKGEEGAETERLETQILWVFTDWEKKYSAVDKENMNVLYEWLA
ncbi:hypothetical protein D9758_010768 [Tetrapyrgos nigripes]|uniref:Uncharacterized protein n=1 Tax=Tetrapyrgos nigripes TaxID=182062 RepID=A0A8H5D8X8_9AGAR|nr:hypothetical protein D9758_010768 [Tetrapyrgos nigripes]